jgi:hypothetical protein
MPNSSRISDSVLDTNIQATIYDISTQVGHALTVSGRARTGYYRVASLLAASIVEALLYHLIEKESARDPSILNRVQSTKQTRLLSLNSATLGTAKTLWIAEVEKNDFTLKGAMLNDMNDFCLKTGLIGPRLYASINFVRDKRNEIHLQGSGTASRRFNGQTLDRIAKVIVQLYNKL